MDDSLNPRNWLGGRWEGSGEAFTFPPMLPDIPGLSQGNMGGPQQNVSTAALKITITPKGKDTGTATGAPDVAAAAQTQSAGPWISDLGRIVIVILGLIFIAAGLFMFKDNRPIITQAKEAVTG